MEHYMHFDAAQPFELPLLREISIDLNDNEIQSALLKARVELAELKGYCSALPNPMLLLSPAIIRESLASSEIENIHTTIENVFRSQLFEEWEQSQPDKEVIRYRDAILWGFENLENFALSTRLILGINEQLLPQHSYTGYRTNQNRIENSTTGEVVFTPPSANRIDELISDWEKFINNQHDGVDPLLKIAIAHYQFEAIHPFGDGNGRTGRILIVLSLVETGILTLPVIYISGYINRNRAEYYSLLLDVSMKKSWKEFILFMLRGLHLQARETKETLLTMMKMYQSFKNIVKSEHSNIYTAELAECLFESPIVTPGRLAEKLGIHRNTASRYLNQLKETGLLKQVVVGKNHFYVYRELLDFLNGRK